MLVLPWKIAFRVQFQSEKFGLRFHPAQFPDTGNGVYTIRLLELIKVRFCKLCGSQFMATLTHSYVS